MRPRGLIVAIASLNLAGMAATAQLPRQRPPTGDRQRAEARIDSAGGDLSLVEMGTDARGIPRYTRRAFSAAERGLLRAAYGVDEPEWLYMSDSSDAALVKYDTKEKSCGICYVNSYRVGFLSLRKPSETWEEFERRLRGKSVNDFSPGARDVQRSLDRLDPEARAAFAELIEAGRRAGFRLSILETYRTPEREALLFALGRGRTHTATSMHSYGRAVDIAVGDGRPNRAATRREWVRFRRFVVHHGDRFRLIGSVDRTWDWPHVELASRSIGFRSIDDALAFSVRCTSDSARAHSPTSARLGGAAPDPCVFIPRLSQIAGGSP